MSTPIDPSLLNIYLSKTIKSRELFQEASKYTPGGVHSSLRYFQPYPFYVSRARGSKVWDVDGNEYIDYVMGYGANIGGHANPAITNAIIEQLENGTLYTFPYELQIKLLRELKSKYPYVDYFRLSNTGSEAVMHAIKLARAYTGRDKIIKIEGSYHGTYDAVSISVEAKPDIWGSDLEPERILESGVPKSFKKDTIVIQYNDLDALERVLKKYGDDIAAMIIEPIMLNSVGVIIPERDYIEDVRKLTQEYNVVLIFDEVKTGFRIAPGGAAEYFKIEPDIAVFGKALGGGVPIAAFGFKEKLADVMYPKGRHTHSGTYNGNPLVVSAAYANQTKVLTNEAYRKLDKLGRELASGIHDIIEDLNLPLCVSSIGSVGAIHFMPREPKNYRDVVLNYDFKAYRLYWVKMLLNNILIRGPIEGEPWFISLAHTNEDIQTTIEKTTVVLREIYSK